jgi:hypothetical protein
LLRELADQLVEHLAAQSPPPEIGSDGKVHDVQQVSIELIDHEADDLLFVFGDHANAVSLAEAADKVVFGPREFEALRFNVENFGHIPANHPADMGSVQQSIT